MTDREGRSKHHKGPKEHPEVWRKTTRAGRRIEMDRRPEQREAGAEEPTGPGFHPDTPRGAGLGILPAHE